MVAWASVLYWLIVNSGGNGLEMERPPNSSIEYPSFVPCIPAREQYHSIALL